MTEPGTSPRAGIEEIHEALRRIEQRLETLEQWRARVEGEPGRSEGSPEPVAAAAAEPPRAAAPAAAEETLLPADLEEDISAGFDLTLIGRTLIVFGGAYLLRALTDGGFVPVAGGVALGLAYAASWSLLALRASVSRESASWHGVATGFMALPLIFEATRKFKVLGPWTAALALAAITAIVLVLVWRRRLEVLAWTFTLLALMVTPVMIMLTESMVPFTLYLTALGVVSVWLGYHFEWILLRWVVGLEVDILLLVLSGLVAVNRLSGVSPAVAIAVSGIAFAAYLSSFVLRTLVRQRDALAFEIAQTIALLICAVGGAMWIAASRSVLEAQVGAAMIVLAGGSYAASFAFIPRQKFATPRNFVFYSSLALMLIVGGGGLITRGLASSILFAVLAVVSGLFAVHFRKSSLALHAAVYLVSGCVGAELVQAGIAGLALRADRVWAMPGLGAIVVLLACVLASAIPPIERLGSFELWTTAKVMILAELGWVLGTFGIILIRRTLPIESANDLAVIAVARTAVIAALTIATAWASRFPTFSPGRILCNPLMVALGMKLAWDDFRVGRPGTLFVSLAIVGVALILTARLKRRANPPQPPAGVATAAA